MIAVVLITAVGVRMFGGQPRISLLLGLWVALEGASLVWILRRRKNITDYPDLNSLVARRWRSEAW